MFSISCFDLVIKWFIKWLLRLAFLMVVLVVLVLVFKDSVLRVVVEKRIRAQTGMEAQIGKFSSRLFSQVFTVENLKLYNTAEFSRTPFLDIAELHIECEPLAFAQGRLRIKLARLNITELDVVKNEAGQTNLFQIRNQLEGGKKKNGLQGTWGGYTLENIEVLKLSLAKAKFIDLKDAKKNREVRVNLQNQIFPNVKSNADVDTILFMIWLRSGGFFASTNQASFRP